eukprot:tig00020660_g12527.t1
MSLESTATTSFGQTETAPAPSAQPTGTTCYSWEPGCKNYSYQALDSETMVVYFADAEAAAADDAADDAAFDLEGEEGVEALAEDGAAAFGSAHESALADLHAAGSPLL